MTFVDELDKLFNEAIGVNDTVWYDESETLRDAILRISEKYLNK